MKWDVVMEEKKKNPSSPWLKVLVLLLLAQNALLIGGGLWLLDKMDQRFGSLEQTLAQTQNIVGEGIDSVSQEMKVVLSESESLTSDFYYTLQPAPRGKVLLTLCAQLKSYENGSAVSFSVTPSGGETILAPTSLKNNSLTSELTLPVCDSVAVGLVVTDSRTTKTQALTEIRGLADCLTEHLLLTPDLEVKQQGADVFLSGSLSLINSFGTLEEQQLDMVRLEITQGETNLHSFYFSQDFQHQQEGQHLHSLQFQRIKLGCHSGEPVNFVVRARDKGGFIYLATVGQLPVSAEGVAGSLSLAEDCEFSLVE